MVTQHAVLFVLGSFEPEGAFFRPWRDTVPGFDYQPGLEVHQIVVPTVDTARFSLLSRRLIAAGRSVFINGPSGCGKTVLMAQLVDQGMQAAVSDAAVVASAAPGAVASPTSDDGLLSPSSASAVSTSTASVALTRLAGTVEGVSAVYAVTINFSGRSVASVTQRTIESRLFKRHGTALGPPSGMQVCQVVCCCS